MTHQRLFLTLLVAALASTANALPTIVTVRAVSRDAKVIGDGVGGARITIRDVESGKVLASGLQTGGTGETKRIMQDPRARGAVVYGTDGAASFKATLELDGPTRVEVIAEGPLKYPQAMQRATRTMLLLPGQHIEGEGVLLEIPGFIVDILGVENRRLRVKVTMTCGCPTEPGGLWNADDIEVTARLTGPVNAVIHAPLKFAGGEPSVYAVELPTLVPGTWNVEVIASDRTAANFGRAAQTITLAP